MGHMTAARIEDGADPDWEYAPLRIPADVSRSIAAAQLTANVPQQRYLNARAARLADAT